MPFFQNPNVENKNIKGQAISSGHFMNEKQVFYAYHWFVRLDGTKVRLLEDNYIGWHAGNWDINTRSIAIGVDGNFENDTPKEIVLEAIANIVNTYYANIPKDKVVGHCEVTMDSISPGNKFLHGWKKDLHKLIKKL